MKNAGKVFEDDFKKSIPRHCFVHRLKDPPQSFGSNSTLRFSWKNPCDFYIFDTISCKLHCLELKSTKGNSISFEVEDDTSKRMIHKHQITSLIEFNEFNNVNCGFLFNFRQVDSMQRTFYQDIEDFRLMILDLDKKSFNVSDLLSSNAVEISGRKLKIRYRWDLKDVFNR